MVGSISGFGMDKNKSNNLKLSSIRII